MAGNCRQIGRQLISVRENRIWPQMNADKAGRLAGFANCSLGSRLFGTILLTGGRRRSAIRDDAGAFLNGEFGAANESNIHR